MKREKTSFQLFVGKGGHPRAMGIRSEVDTSKTAVIVNDLAADDALANDSATDDIAMVDTMTDHRCPFQPSSY